ncbi:tyrosine-type recombinase/integrase [Frigoriglobus tundricola]|uniref:Site-specific recombinase XerC n=1 Tax=Frigoriglobus tundricola TaxID=2774151 RepID=A0A6M5YMM7_9BACT|nr:tyrosine-type recombinase/integrase [Frigoriglobus tundricola]QJW95379.1 Site-specific recombinase XerC [Frigoriglobus tundricola]
MSGELVVVDKAEDMVRINPASIMPLAIRQAGPKAEEKFAEFFAATIRNVNTRMAYLRAVNNLFAWIEDRGFKLIHLRPLHVAAYIEQFTRERSAPTVKQNLAAIRMLFDYLVVGQVLEMNPAAAVRGPSYSAKKGKTPVLDQDEARQLLDNIDTTNVVGLRDRAVIALMVYTFARVGALAAMNVEDYYPQGKRWWVRLHEKGGKLHEVPAHHKLEEFLDAYLDQAGLWEQKKLPLFRVTRGKTKKLTGGRMSRRDVYEMVRRRAAAAGIETAIGCHTFRATGITNYLINGGTLEKAQQIANHESARTTKLYDRRDDRLSLDEVERITI